MALSRIVGAMAGVRPLIRQRYNFAVVIGPHGQGPSPIKTPRSDRHQPQRQSHEGDLFDPRLQHPHFFLPVNDLTNANAGRVLSANDSRQIQLGLKFNY